MSYKLQVFNIGQGLFTLLAGEEFCMLADCGTLMRNPDIAPDDILEYAVEMIHEAGGLNAVFISHQDDDHWSFLEGLMERLYPGREGNVWYKKTDTAERAKMLDENGCYHECSRFAYGYSHMVFFEENYTGWKPCKTVCRQSAQVTYSEFLDREAKICRYQIQYPIPALDTIVRLSFVSSLRSHPLRFILEGIKIKISACGLSYAEHFEEAEDDVQLVKEQVTLFFDLLRDELGRSRWSFGWYVNNITKIFQVLYRALDAENIMAVPAYIDEAEIIGEGPDIYMGGGMCGQSYCRLQTKMRLYGKLETYDTSTFLHVWFGSSQKVYSHNLVLEELEQAAAKHSLNNTEIYRNATSLIVCYEDISSYRRIVFPGDSTVHAFNSLLELWQNSADSRQTDVVIAPHHGSGNTNIVWQFKNGNLSEAEDQPVIKFLEAADPSWLIISAYHEKFGHPEASFVMKAEEVLTRRADPHELGMTVGGRFEPFTIGSPVYSTETQGGMEIRIEDGGLILSNPLARGEKLITPPDDCFIDGCRLQRG